MRRWTLVGLLLLCAVVAAHAQSFKLYYANNVTDVTDLDNIEKDTHLNWREVASGSSIAFDGNMVEVSNLKTMFAQERMKTLDDKRQFWKM